MATSVFLLVTALLVDVLTVIGILSLTFQKDTVNLSSIRHYVDSTINTLNTMSTGSSTVNDVLHAISQTDDLDTEVKYKNIAIKHNQNLTRQKLRVLGEIC